MKKEYVKPEIKIIDLGNLELLKKIKREITLTCKGLRLSKKISCRELSKIFNLEESAISEIERGKRNLTIDMLFKYCDFFNVSSNYILGF